MRTHIADDIANGDPFRTTRGWYRTLCGLKYGPGRPRDGIKTAQAGEAADCRTCISQHRHGTPRPPSALPRLPKGVTEVVA